MNVREMREKRANLVEQARALLDRVDEEKRNLTPDEQGQYDGMMAEMGRLKDSIAQREALETEERALGDPLNRVHRPELDGDDEDPDTKRSKWGSMGEQLMAVRDAALPGRSLDPRLEDRAVLGQSAGVGSEGGFLLETEYTAGLWQRAYETGEILGRTFKVPIGDNANTVEINGMAETSRATGSRWGGVQAYWVTEAGTLTASDAQFRKMRFTPKKLAVLVYATAEMLRNPVTLESVINQVVPQELAWMSENACMRGSGVGKPLGILNSAALISVDAEAGQAADTVVSENISKMWSRMWAKSRANAVWMINQDVEPQLDQLSVQVGVGGVPVYMPAGGLADAPYGRLKGRPVIPMEYCSTVGDLGDIVLADWSQYGVSDRGSVRAASSIHVQFLTDQVAYRFIYEIDGQSMWDAALTPANGSNTLSPFVALAAR